EKDGFRLNIMYTDPQPLNYISPVAGTTLPDDVANTPLLNVFNLDRLNSTDDPQNGGDRWFDYISNNPTSNAFNSNSQGGYGQGGNYAQGGGYGHNRGALQTNNKFGGITV